MSIFGTIYRYELKKIFQKKYLLFALLLMIAVAVFLNVYPLFGYQDAAYLDSEKGFVFERMSRYQAIQLERRFAEDFSGQLLDNEAAVSARNESAQYQERYSAFEPERNCVLLNHHLSYDMLSNLGINPQTEWTDQIADFAYQTMRESQENEYESQLLTDEEIDFWDQERGKITTPFRMAFSGGYRGMIENAHWLNMMAVVFILISLCSSFSDDDYYQIKPLLSSTRHGRRRLLFARLAAGESVACGSVLMLFGLTAIIHFFIYGTDGFLTPIQALSQNLSGSSKALNGGQAVLLMIGFSLLLAFFAGAISMALSKLFQKAVPALALPMGLLLLSLVFDVIFYSRNRLLSQIWSYFPFQRVSETLLLDERMVSIGGVKLDCVSMSVLIYGSIAVISLIVCIVVFKIRAVDRK